MQVAKYWRNNQLRYRLNGIVQQKVDFVTVDNMVDATARKSEKASESTTKVKVA